jgi:tetratricopeptide (TPR) repeat protein
MIKKIFLFTLLLFCNTSQNFSQTYEERIQKGINYIYNLNFDSAKTEFDEVIKADPSNPAGYFFLSMVDWWRINLNKENDSLDEKFLKEAERVIEVADEKLDKNENDDNAMFYKGGALGYSGLVKSLRESWLKAAEYGREALNLLQKAYDKNRNNKDVLFGIGLYNYFAEYVPDTYPAVKPLMIIFPKGDKLKGLSQIKETSNDSRFTKIEARYVLAYLNLVYEKNYMEAEYYSRLLHEAFPQNPIFEKYLFTSFVGEGKWDSAYYGWKNIVEKIDSNKYGYNNLNLKREANYYAALSLCKMNRINEAEPYIKTAEEITKQIDKENEHAYSSFIYLLSGMLNDVKGNISTADYYYDKVLGMKDFQNSHAEAEKLKRDRYKE